MRVTVNMKYPILEWWFMFDICDKQDLFKDKKNY